MNRPLPIMMLLSAGAGSGEGEYVIYLNRSGINSIDCPREKVLAEPGAGLVLKCLNRGAPIHITITSSNASMFTDFFHENMYIVDEGVLSIPIRKDCGEGNVAGLCYRSTTHEIKSSGRIPIATGSPWPAPPFNGRDGYRADHLLRMAVYGY